MRTWRPQHSQTQAGGWNAAAQAMPPRMEASHTDLQAMTVIPEWDAAA